MSLSILILGLSVTSSWGNGHATTYRGLMRELVRRGHRVTFLERDMPWYADNRDLPKPPYGRTMLYASVDELRRRWSATVTAADVIILGSFVPDGAEIAKWLIARSRGLTAFYDIDTPVTMAKLEKGGADYLTLDLVPQFDLYLSFTGGPTLARLEREFGARIARPLYCSADTDIYKPLNHPIKWDLGYIGTYSADRQPALERLLIKPLGELPKAKGIVAGPQYPEDVAWPKNVRRIEHLAPDRHRAFYAAQRFTLNVTRRDMVRAGFSPSIRLFEAAATGTPIISDWWQGLDQFFTPGEEIVVAKSGEDVVRTLGGMGEEKRRAIAERARARVLAQHTAAHRALELEAYIREAAQHRRERRLQTRLAGDGRTPAGRALTQTLQQERWDRREIERQVRALGPWFHNLDLRGVKTAPDHFLGDYPALKWRQFAEAVPADLGGASVLDIGCNAGFYSLEMKRRGADRVVGIDSDDTYLAQARFAAEVCGADIEFRNLSVYDLAKLEERFDLVLFMGVLYHLRHPLLALDLIHEHAARDLLLFQSMLRGCGDIETVGEDYPFAERELFDRPGAPRLHFIERSFAGDPTNWWVPNAACAEAMLRSAGFQILSRPEEEVWLCRRGERPEWSGPVYPAYRKDS